MKNKLFSFAVFYMRASWPSSSTSSSSSQIETVTWDDGGVDSRSGWGNPLLSHPRRHLPLRRCFPGSSTLFLYPDWGSSEGRECTLIRNLCSNRHLDGWCPFRGLPTRFLKWSSPTPGFLWFKCSERYAHETQLILYVHFGDFGLDNHEWICRGLPRSKA